MDQQQLIDSVFQKVVEKKLKSDLVMAMKALQKIAEDHAFLFDGDVLKAQCTLVQACIREDRPLFNEDDELQLDFSIVQKNVSNEVKQQIFENILSEIAINADFNKIVKREEAES